MSLRAHLPLHSQTLLKKGKGKKGMEGIEQPLTNINAYCAFFFFFCELTHFSSLFHLLGFHSEARGPNQA